MGSTASEPRYYVGIDLGQSRDPTAIAVVRRVEPPGPVPEDDFGLKPKPNHQPASVEWQEEQRRRKKGGCAGITNARDRVQKGKRKRKLVVRHTPQTRAALTRAPE